MKQITLGSNVMVSDPCYSNDTWCQSKLKDVLPGKYNVEVDFTDEGDWGHRVAGVTVLHESYEDDGISFDWEDQDEVGVDSGQCGIFDMESYRNDTVAETIETPESDFFLGDHRKEESGESWYEKMCRFTLSKDQWGSYDTGVVTSSGLGDGVYPVEILKDKEKIIGIRITYLGHSDKEFLDEEGDCCGVCGGELESDGSCNYCDSQED